MAKLVFALELFVAAFAAQGTLEVLAILALTICVGVVSQNAQKTFKLVFGFAVLGLILCVVQTLVAPAGQTLFLFITVEVWSAVLTACHKQLRWHCHCFLCFRLCV